MRYGLYLADLRPAQNDSQGIINYAMGLAAELPQLLEPSERLFVLANEEIAPHLRWDSTAALPVVDVVTAPRGIVGRLALDHLRSIRWAGRRRLNALHFPKGYLPAWTPSQLATVVTVHDDIPLMYARGHFHVGRRSAKSMYFARALRRSAAGADRVLTVSAFSAGRLAELGSVNPSKVVVTHEAPTLPSLPFYPLSVRNPVIVILGSRFPHKRTAQVVLWSQRFVHTAGGAGLRVVVTGRLDPHSERLCTDHRIERVPSTMSILELARLVARCRVLVFGSAYEGFGLPPVEAYSLGTPATYQRIGAMAEVLDGFPGGYDPPCYEQFAEAMSAVLALDDNSLLALQSTMRERFRWSEVARLTLDAYRSAARDVIT